MQLNLAHAVTTTVPPKITKIFKCIFSQFAIFYALSAICVYAQIFPGHQSVVRRITFDGGKIDRHLSKVRSVNRPGFLKGTSHTMSGHDPANIERTHCLARFDLLVRVDRAVPEGRVTETA